jgi:hypothetical protein
MKSMLFLLALAASAAYGQQSTASGQPGVISQIVDGDGWQTLISLNNIDAAPSNYKLSFFDDTGAPLSVQNDILTGSVIYGAIPAHGSVTIHTAGTQVPLSQGWALLETIFTEPLTSAITPGATVAGTVIFQRPPTVSRPSEVSEPLDFSSKSQWVLPFDHTNGYTSGVALANPSTSQDISVFLTFFDNSGATLLQPSAFTLPRGQHTAITLTQQYPQIIGRLGTLKITTSGPPINVLGFHISPAGVFTSTSPTSW